MKTLDGRTHITDDMGNDVTLSPMDEEFAALRTVAEAADHDHRVHCLLLTANCPICKALADLDEVQQRQFQAHRN